MNTLMKVWPLRPGLTGCDALGNPLILTPGLAGWMAEDKARAADAAGEVQIMAGLRPKDLKPPTLSAAVTAEEEAPSAPSAKKPAKKRVYRRRDVQAEKPTDE